VTYRILADAVLVLHLAYIAFVMLGGLAVLRWPRLAWLHLPAVLWGAGIAFAGGYCPLTPLENSLRVAGGGTGYEGSFIEQYLTALIYPEGLTRGIQIALGCAVVAVNLAVYLRLFNRGRSLKGDPKGDSHL
jgi:hypothetical protein